AALLGHRLSEVGEEHREPEPEGNLQFEADSRALRDVADEQDRGQDAADLDDEHHWVSHHLDRVQFAKRVEERAPDDLRIPNGNSFMLCHNYLRISTARGTDSLNNQ